MRLSQRHGLSIGLALFSCAVVALQIVFMRVAAVLIGEHVSLLAAATPLFGGALGALLLCVIPPLARPPRLLAHLAYLACAAAALSLISMIVAVQPYWADAAPRRASILFGVFSLPGLFAGAAFAAAIRGASGSAGRIAFAGLLGAAIGAPLSIALLTYAGHRAGLIAAVIAASSAVFFYSASGSPEADGASPGERRPVAGVIATLLLGSSVVLAGDIGAPWLKLPNLRFLRLDKVDLQRWSERSLITVDRPAAGVATLTLDGSRSSPILEAKKNPDAHPFDIAYTLNKDRGPSLIIAPGGGSDVRRALRVGQKTIHVVEPDRIVVADVFRDKYREHSGDLYGRPEVTVAVAESRAYLRRAPAPFQSIVVSLPESSAASTAGVLSLSQSPLLTVEGVREMLDRLTPSGTLLLSRSEHELDRLISLAAASLRGVGAASPKDHLYACNHDRVASLLIKRSPLTLSDINALRAVCRKGRFQESFAPDAPKDGLRRRLTDSPAAAVAPPNAPDLTPPDDDRPFFAYTTQARALSTALRDPRALTKDSQGLLAILALIAAGLAASLLLFLLPLISRPSFLIRAEARGSRALALLYFASLGAGAVLAGASLVQHASSLIAHPAYGLAGAVGVVLFFASMGALFAGSIAARRAALAAGRRAQILTAVLALLAAFAGPLFRLGLNLPMAGRVAVAAALAAPIAALIGSLFPLGVRLVAQRSLNILPWCAGVHRAAALVALGVGALLAVHAGFSALFFVAGLAYFVAALTVPVDRSSAGFAEVAPVTLMPVEASPRSPEPELGYGPPPAGPEPGFGPPPAEPEFVPDDAPPTVPGRRLGLAPVSDLPSTQPSAAKGEPKQGD